MTPAGHLHSTDDRFSLDKLRQLASNVSTAFVTPIRVATRDGIYFELAQSARFADELGAAQQVVVLLPGDRLEERHDGGTNNGRLYRALELLWDNPNGRLTFVISQPEAPLSPRPGELRARGANVFIDTRNGWQHLPAGGDEILALGEPT